MLIAPNATASNYGRGEEYEIEEILDPRQRGKNTQYLMQWKGYLESKHGLECARYVHVPGLVQQFHQYFPEKP